MLDQCRKQQQSFLQNHGFPGTVNYFGIVSARSDIPCLVVMKVSRVRSSYNIDIYVNKSRFINPKAKNHN